MDSISEISSSNTKKPNLDGLNTGVKSMAKVIGLKSRTQDILNKKNEELSNKITSDIDDFSQKIEEYFEYGILTMPTHKFDQFMDACTFLGNIFTEFGLEPEYYGKIYDANINALDLESKFIKTLLGLLAKGPDSLNYKNMKGYIRILAKKHSKDIPEYKYLKENLDEIIEATTSLISEGNYSPNTDFLKYSSFYNQELHEEK
ncbi:MAG: hypothetical protein PHZ26_04520 [Candidatus Gracilibacteria bacterium]|nr:hypothetical protein [Candidatus Gracilibacteria bacterium]